MSRLNWKDRRGSFSNCAPMTEPCDESEAETIRTLQAEIKRLREEIQTLRDEVDRLRQPLDLRGRSSDRSVF